MRKRNKHTVSERKVNLKHEIINVAGDIFNKFGYRKATLNDIAEKIEKRKSAIYYYFDSKEEIFQSVVLHEARTFRKNIINAINKEDNPHDKLKAYIVTRMNIIELLGNFNRALQDKKLMHLDFVIRLKKLYDKEEVLLFKNILQNGVNQNYFQIYDIDLAATAFITALRGMESTILQNKQAPDIDQQIGGIIDIIFYGIVKRE
jgi:AcrR family transcriptional regulator